jgi:hypothetical protein
MVMFAVTDSDVKRAYKPKPGWYAIDIQEQKDESSDKDGSMNCVLDFVVLGGPDPEAVGVPIRHWFNEKAPSFIGPFVEALGQEFKPGSFELGKNLIGMKLDGYIKQEPFGGRMVNKVTEFAPLGVNSGYTAA